MRKHCGNYGNPEPPSSCAHFFREWGICEGGIDSFNRTWTSSTERAALSMAESMEIEERRREKHMELLDKNKGESCDIATEGRTTRIKKR